MSFTIAANNNLAAINPPAETLVNKTVGQKIASLFIPHYDLDNQLKSIKGKVQRDPAYALNEQELSQLKEAFKQSSSTFGKKLLKSLSQLPPADILKAIVIFMEEQEGKGGFHSTLGQFLQMMDAEGLKRLTNLDDQKVRENIQAQTILKDEAVKSVLQAKGKAIWKELSVEVFYFIHHLIDVCITWTGLTEVKGHSKRNMFNIEMGAYEAKAKIEAYLALLGYPSIIFASAFAICNSAVVAGAATAGIVICSLLMIPIYMRYLRPCPKEYDGLKNLNDKILQKNYVPIYKRRDVLMRIQNAFSAGKGVILTAAPGVGKTTIVDSLAELIVTKQSEKFLWNAQLFSANASRMGDDMIGLNLNGLDNTFKNHSNKVVFFFDEIASIFRENVLRGRPSESLLTFHHDYRYIICATTTEQYNATIRDREESFNRRFVHIEIQPLERTELEIALYELLHFKAPELAVQEDVIPYIIDKASTFNAQTSQVDAATSLLSAAIVKATVLTGGDIDSEVNALSLELESLQKNMLHKGPSSTFTEDIQRYQQVENDLKAKKILLTKRRAELTKIKKLEQACLKFKHATYKLASEVKNDNPRKTQQWLKKQAYFKILSEYLMHKKVKVGLPSSINKELIDQIIRGA